MKTANSASLRMAELWLLSRLQSAPLCRLGLFPAQGRHFVFDILSTDIALFLDVHTHNSFRDERNVLSRFRVIFGSWTMPEILTAYLLFLQKHDSFPEGQQLQSTAHVRTLLARHAQSILPGSLSRVDRQALDFDTRVCFETLEATLFAIECVAESFKRDSDSSISDLPLIPEAPDRTASAGENNVSATGLTSQMGFNPPIGSIAAPGGNKRKLLSVETENFFSRSKRTCSLAAEHRAGAWAASPASPLCMAL